MSTSAVTSTEKKQPRGRKVAWLVYNATLTLVLAAIVWLLSVMVDLDTRNDYVSMRNWIAVVMLVSLGLTINAFRKCRSKP